MVTLDEGHKVLPVDDDGDLNIIATFDRRGRYIYTGNAKGRVLVMQSSDFKVSRRRSSQADQRGNEAMVASKGHGFDHYLSNVMVKNMVLFVKRLKCVGASSGV